MRKNCIHLTHHWRWLYLFTNRSLFVCFRFTTVSSFLLKMQKQDDLKGTSRFLYFSHVLLYIILLKRQLPIKFWTLTQLKILTEISSCTFWNELFKMNNHNLKNHSNIKTKFWHLSLGVLLSWADLSIVWKTFAELK